MFLLGNDGENRGTVRAPIKGDRDVKGGNSGRREVTVQLNGKNFKASAMTLSMHSFLAGSFTHGSALAP
jgi:hypothetical protein